MNRPADLFRAPLVVGTIHSPAALQCALRLDPGRVDVLELRVDAFCEDPLSLDALQRAVPFLRAPLLLTVRHPEEGGMAPNLARDRRCALFRQFLPLVQWVDFEVRSLDVLAEEIAYASELGVRTIVSDHHFAGTPALDLLEERFALAQCCRPSLVKVAATVTTPTDLARLLEFLNERQRQAPGQLSVMGMGPYGQVSRLVLGSCGSVLNYGYLDRAQVPGQWPAELLKVRLGELLGTAQANP